MSDESEITDDMLEMVAIQRCLRQFRGNWELNILWLRDQAKGDQCHQTDDLERAINLMERDREVGLCEEVLVGEIVSSLGSLDREELIDVRSYCEALQRAKQNGDDLDDDFDEEEDEDAGNW